MDRRDTLAGISHKPSMSVLTTLAGDAHDLHAIGHIPRDYCAGSHHARGAEDGSLAYLAPLRHGCRGMHQGGEAEPLLRHLLNEPAAKRDGLGDLIGKTSGATLLTSYESWFIL